MIEKIKQVLKLQAELKELHDVISIDERFLDGDQAQVNDIEVFLSDSEGHEVRDGGRDDLDYPYEISYVSGGVKVFCILNTEEYQSYKKATATTVASEKL